MKVAESIDVTSRAGPCWPSRSSEICVNQSSEVEGRNFDRVPFLPAGSYWLSMLSTRYASCSPNAWAEGPPHLNTSESEPSHILQFRILVNTYWSLTLTPITRITPGGRRDDEVWQIFCACICKYDILQDTLFYLNEPCTCPTPYRTCRTARASCCDRFPSLATSSWARSPRSAAAAASPIVIVPSPPIPATAARFN